MEIENPNRAGLTEECISQYFHMKTTEARNEGNEQLVNLLEASRKLWLHNGTMHIRMIQSIGIWHSRTIEMERWAEIPDPKTESRMHQAMAGIFGVFLTLLGVSFYIAMTTNKAAWGAVIVLTLVDWHMGLQVISNYRRRA